MLRILPSVRGQDRYADNGEAESHSLRGALSLDTGGQPQQCSLSVVFGYGSAEFIYKWACMIEESR